MDINYCSCRLLTANVFMFYRTPETKLSLSLQAMSLQATNFLNFCIKKILFFAILFALLIIRIGINLLYLPYFAVLALEEDV